MLYYTSLKAPTGKYLFRNHTLRLAMDILDVLFDFFSGSKNKNSPIPAPRRVLISNGAHLGDVIIATTIIHYLKSSFPAAEFGFLVGSWSVPIVELFPEIQSIHILDHCMLNRSPISFWRKILVHFRTSLLALSQIRKNNYDVAIELLPFLPNNIPLLWASGIPYRIGHKSGGFGAMLTHPMDWNHQPCLIGDINLNLLKALGIHVSPGRKIIWPKRNATVLEKGFLPERPYLVLHPGAGADYKQWPIKNWKSLVKQLADDGMMVIFTGHGHGESEMIREISASAQNYLNYCNALKLHQFIEIIARADVIVGVDSLAGHLAAMVGTPSVTISPGIRPFLFPPHSEVAQVLMHPVPCSPCFIAGGCAHMECVRNVKVDEVVQAILRAKDLTVRSEIRGESTDIFLVADTTNFDS